MIKLLFQSDCLLKLKEIDYASIDMIFADPPYFLSNGGKSIKNGEIVSVDKGDWDKKENYSNIEEFSYSWLESCYKILKNNGTIWVTGTHHNIYDIYSNMTKIGYKVINMIIWHKPNPPDLIYKNKFKFSYESIIWAKKGGQHKFNYKYVFELENQEMTDVWTIPSVGKNEKQFGYHPTQKPIELLNRIILSCTHTGDTILDPFMGSGTTGVSAISLRRKFIGIEKDEKYFAIATKRINSTTCKYNSALYK